MEAFLQPRQEEPAGRGSRLGFLCHLLGARLSADDADTLALGPFPWKAVTLTGEDGAALKADHEAGDGAVFIIPVPTVRTPGLCSGLAGCWDPVTWCRLQELAVTSCKGEEGRKGVQRTGRGKEERKEEQTF